jgi:DNA-binding NtrC family response regulator
MARTKTRTTSKASTSTSKTAKRNRGRRTQPVKRPARVLPPSAESKALGAMLASERWYATAVAHILQAVYATRGNATHTANELGVSWRSLRDWCANYPELQRALEHARNAG